jgi:hypothetical protein
VISMPIRNCDCTWIVSIQSRREFEGAVMLAFEAADCSFATVNQHTADWALSRGKRRGYQRASLTMLCHFSL